MTSITQLSTHIEECKNEPRKICGNTSREHLPREEHKNKIRITQSENSAEDLHRKEQTSKLKNTLMETSSKQLHRTENKNQLYDSLTDDLPNEKCDTRSHDSFTDTRLDTSKLPAPDGGYGWFVVLGCFISHVVFAGFDRSEGILFLLLTSKFEQSAQLTSWPGAIACTLQLLLGPLATAVSNRYSPRIAVMLGAVLVFLGTLLSSFSPSFIFYFICHGFIDGFGRGLAYVPGLSMVGMYFDKRAGLAVGLATSGAGIGTFVIVPFTQYLADNFGFQGTFLILSGVACHLFIAALLYRPLRVHYQSIHSDRGRRSRPKNEAGSCTDLSVGKDELEKLNIHTSGNTILQTALNETSTERPSTSITNSNAAYNVKANHFLRTSNIHTNISRNNKVNEVNSCMYSFQVCCPVDPNKKQPDQCFDFHLLKNRPFMMFCLSIFMFTMAFRAAFTFIPALIESKGIPKSQAALALSAAGAVDTFGRIGAGLFLDLERIRPYRLALYNSVIFAVGFVAFFLPLMTNISMFCVMSGLYGLLTGAYISQKSVVLADILDPPDVASSFGILMVFQGLGGLFGPPLAGALRDVFGGYDESFYFGGGLLVLAGLLMVLCNICNRLVKRNIVS